MFKWFLKPGFFGFLNWVWVALVVASLALAVLWATSAEKADDKANQTIGAVTQREGDLRETVKRTEEGNAAREEIRKPDRAGACARYDQCVRSSRPSAAGNCVRFLPELSSGFGCPGTLTGSGRPGE